MAYDRYESRRGWREPRGTFSDDYRERGEDRFNRERGEDRFNRERDEERGFFERAGDEVASWFGDEEAERRRREDMGRFGDDDGSRFDRSARYRDEGYRRPYTGRFGGQGPGDFGPDRGDRQPYRPMTGDYGRGLEDPVEGGGSYYGVGAHHDRHYGEWRARQLDELDRDYDAYARENRSRFEDDFTNWRQRRQSKRQLLGQVREHMEVVGSDGEHVGTVDRATGDRLILTKSDPESGGAHHSLMCTAVDRVEGDKVFLDMKAEEARKQWRDESRDRALFEREDQGEAGPGILNRSFSGTY